MITKPNYNMNIFIDSLKEFVNIIALTFGVVATFFGDFPKYSYSFLRSRTAEILFIDVNADTLTKADLIVSMGMRIIVGFGTLMIAYHLGKKKQKRDEQQN